MKQRLLLDIMLNERWQCQLRYYKRGFPRIVDGKIVEVYDMCDLRRFVEEQRPSLIGKPYVIEISNQPKY